MCGYLRSKNISHIGFICFKQRRKTHRMALCAPNFFIIPLKIMINKNWGRKNRARNWEDVEKHTHIVKLLCRAWDCKVEKRGNECIYFSHLRTLFWDAIRGRNPQKWCRVERKIGNNNWKMFFHCSTENKNRNKNGKECQGRDTSLNF